MSILVRNQIFTVLYLNLKKQITEVDIMINIKPSGSTVFDKPGRIYSEEQPGDPKRKHIFKARYFVVYFFRCYDSFKERATYKPHPTRRLVDLCCGCFWIKNRMYRRSHLHHLHHLRSLPWIYGLHTFPAATSTLQKSATQVPGTGAAFGGTGCFFTGGPTETGRPSTYLPADVNNIAIATNMCLDNHWFHLRAGTTWKLYLRV